MPRVILSRRALAHLQRLVDFPGKDDASAAASAWHAIHSGIAVLEEHPLVGRRVTSELRELLISHGRTGYVALYRLIPARSMVRILGFRHQRELHYPL